MRKKNQKQLPLMASVIEHPRAKELEQISQILDSIPTINEMVLQDLSRDGTNPTGAEGMTAEQIVRAAIIKKTEGFSYEELAFHLADSITYRAFCRIGIAHRTFKKSALCRNIKSVSPETWEAIEAVARQSGNGFQQPADEVFADLLKRHKQPVGLKAPPKRNGPRRLVLRPFQGTDPRVGIV